MKRFSMMFSGLLLISSFFVACSSLVAQLPNPLMQETFASSITEDGCQFDYVQMSQNVEAESFKTPNTVLKLHIKNVSNVEKNLWMLDQVQYRNEPNHGTLNGYSVGCFNEMNGTSGYRNTKITLQPNEECDLYIYSMYRDPNNIPSIIHDAQFAIKINNIKHIIVNHELPIPFGVD